MYATPYFEMVDKLSMIFLIANFIWVSVIEGIWINMISAI